MISNFNEMKDLQKMLKEFLIINLMKNSQKNKKWVIISNYLINLSKNNKRVTVSEACKFLKIDRKNLIRILSKMTGFNSWTVIIKLLTNDFFIKNEKAT